MLTFFTTAKPFVGHSAIVQRNALQSWKRLHKGVEVILFGNEEGAEEVSAELGLRHEPHVERHESGVKYLNSMFERAQQAAQNEYLCYSNCDIVLMGDFWKAFERVRAWRERFLLVGRRWDTDITEPIHFEERDWEEHWRAFAVKRGFHQNPHFIDYFVFRRNEFAEVPPLVVGRSYWDWWIVRKALENGTAVVNCSSCVAAIHQNHGYTYHPGGKLGTHSDELAARNYELGGGKLLRNMEDATHRMNRRGKISRRPVRLPLWTWKMWCMGMMISAKWKLRATKERAIYGVRLPTWHFVLGITRPVRTALGLRSKAMRRTRRA